MIREPNLYDLEDQRIERRLAVSRKANIGRNLCRALSTILAIATLCSIPSAIHSMAGAACLAACAGLTLLCYRQVRRIDKWEKREMRS